jgi:triosephosphate isomerase
MKYDDEIHNIDIVHAFNVFILPTRFSSRKHTCHANSTLRQTISTVPNILQQVCPQLKGAYTGAISTSMLKSIGVEWALAGHSERREIYGETDDYINAQCLKIIDEGMSVMLCIGESLAEFEQDLAGSVCAVQLKKGLKGINRENLDRVAIAYEPVWAIGE